MIIRNLLLFMAFSLTSLLSGCGSHSSDFPGLTQTENPLPPCKNSLSCVLITKSYPDSIDFVWNDVLSALKKMRPYDFEITGDIYRIDLIFLVTFFRDDMVVQLEESDSTTHAHIRSSSRIGFTDFGVNRRRVKRLLKLMGDGY